MKWSRNIEAHRADCIEKMRDISDGFFDLAIVDPPYGIGAPEMGMGENTGRNPGRVGVKSTARKQKRRNSMKGSGRLKDRTLNIMGADWDKEPPGPEYFAELFRVSKNQIIFGGNYFLLPPTRCVICWDKRQPWRNFSQWEMAWTSFGKPSIIYRISNTGGNNRRAKIHPTQKPVALYLQILKDFARPGFKILDTHFGSASLAIACEIQGLDLVCYEINPEYYKAAHSRFMSWKNEGDIIFDNA